jgi:predicted DNA binding CopG/RHH family protein
MRKQKNNNPFENLILDEEEKALEEALERGEFEEMGNLEETKKMLKEAVEQYRQLHTSKPVTIRINQLDLIKIKAKAKRQQIPYQTLLGALLHKFAEGERELSLK